MATAMENGRIREAEEKQETGEESGRSARRRDLEDGVTPVFLML